MPSQRIYDPEIEAVARIFPIMDMSDADGARATVARFRAEMAKQGATRPVDPDIEEIERIIPGPDGAPDIPIRIYMPKDREQAGPGFVNFHGGGFVLGDLENEHLRCLELTAKGGAVAVGIDYRLAPENPFPAGVEDCFAGLRWVADNAAELKIDPSRIAIGGGSAGGALSAAVALMARDRGGPHVAFQMLFYPVVDDHCATTSMDEADDCYIWNRRNNLDIWDQYLGKDRGEVSPYAAPARATDLSGLAPAFITTAEHDPLRDEAIVYAMRLMNAGVPVELINYPGTAHAFDVLIPSAAADRAMADQVAAFRRAVG